MGNEFVSVRAHLDNVLIKESLSQAQMVKKVRKKPFVISHGLSPVVLGSVIPEHLAPFEHAYIEKVIVYGDPELLSCPLAPCVTSRAMERQIAQTMQAKNSGPAHAFTTVHVSSLRFEFFVFHAFLRKPEVIAILVYLVAYPGYFA